MRYILVNVKGKPDEWCCTLCCDPIETCYVRCLGTRLVYCTPRCFTYHEQTSELAIEHHARSTS